MHQHQGLNHPSHPKQMEKPNEIQKQNILLSPKTLNRHNLRDKIVPSLFHGNPKPESAPTASRFWASSRKSLSAFPPPKTPHFELPPSFRSTTEKIFPLLAASFCSFPKNPPPPMLFPPPKSLHLLSSFFPAHSPVFSSHLAATMQPTWAWSEEQQKNNNNNSPPESSSPRVGVYTPLFAFPFVIFFRLIYLFRTHF